MVKRSRPEFPCEEVYALVDGAGDVAGGIDMRADDIVITCSLCSRKCELQCGHLLAQLIVKVSRDPAPFVLLGDDQAVKNVLVVRRLLGEAAGGEIAGDSRCR